jgi:glycerol-3-phosphate dehydrogenase
MAAEVVETAMKMLRLTGKLPAGLTPAQTDREPLPGAHGWPEDDDASRLVSQVRSVGGENIADDVARNLVGTYGTRALEVARLARNDAALCARLIPDRPEILAQVDFAVTDELASDVSDFMVRRTQIFYRDVDQGLTAVDVVTARIALLLGWDAERAARSAADYREDVARSRRWREPSPAA